MPRCFQESWRSPGNAPQYFLDLSMARARKSLALIPVAAKAAPTAAPTVSIPTPTATPASRRLWFCVYLPNLPLEACGAREEALAVVEDQQGIHRVRLVNAAAANAGVMPGQSANAALALVPTLQLEERNTLREQQVLESLATWLEQFSSFVSIAGNNVLLPKPASGFLMKSEIRSQKSAKTTIGNLFLTSDL